MSAVAVSSQLVGRARKAWEDAVLEDARLENSTDVFLVSTLLRYCQGKAVCWPTMGTLAAKMKLSERTICSAVKRLVKAGVLRLLKDTSLRQGRRFVIASHPDAGNAVDGPKPARKPAADTAVRCGDTRKPLRSNTRVNTDSSDSKESSSSARRDDESSEEIVTVVQAILPPEDAASVVREHRFLLRKAQGKPDIVLKAVDHARQHRPRIRRIVPYVITLIDSLVAGVPLFQVDRPVPVSFESSGPPPRITRASPEKRAWYEAKYKRPHSPPVAMPC